MCKKGGGTSRNGVRRFGGGGGGGGVGVCKTNRVSGAETIPHSDKKRSIVFCPARDCGGRQRRKKRERTWTLPIYGCTGLGEADDPTSDKLCLKVAEKPKKK